MAGKRTPSVPQPRPGFPPGHEPKPGPDLPGSCPSARLPPRLLQTLVLQVPPLPPGTLDPQGLVPVGPASPLSSGATQDTTKGQSPGPGRAGTCRACGDQKERSPGKVSASLPPAKGGLRHLWVQSQDTGVGGTMVCQDSPKTQPLKPSRACSGSLSSLQAQRCGDRAQGPAGSRAPRPTA